MEIYDENYFVRRLILLIPTQEKVYQEHMEYNEELLSHVFFAEAINQPLYYLLELNQDKETIAKFITVIEEMMEQGNEAVKNIVFVTILERLGDDDVVLKNAFSYFSETLIMASTEVEAFLGRRTIKISRRRGKIMTSW